MPLKKKFREGEEIVPRWVKEIEDNCLFEIVMKAFHVRGAAIRAEAHLHEPCKTVLERADEMMLAIRDERVTGMEAWDHAADAIRKFNTVVECAKPTATRFELRERKPRRR